MITKANLRRPATADALLTSPYDRVLLSGHPPLEKRLARLAAMVRELETPLGA